MCKIPYSLQLLPSVLSAQLKLKETYQATNHIYIFNICIYVYICKISYSQHSSSVHSAQLKLKETYQATNRRMCQALVDAKFDELLSTEGKTKHSVCSFLPFCA